MCERLNRLVNEDGISRPMGWIIYFLWLVVVMNAKAFISTSKDFISMFLYGFIIRRLN